MAGYSVHLYLQVYGGVQRMLDSNKSPQNNCVQTFNLLWAALKDMITNFWSPKGGRSAPFLLLRSLSGEN